MKLSEDLKSYADGMSQDIKDSRDYKAGDVYAVAGYIRRKGVEVAQLEEENAELLEVLERIAELSPDQWDTDYIVPLVQKISKEAIRNIKENNDED